MYVLTQFLLYQYVVLAQGQVGSFINISFLPPAVPAHPIVITVPYTASPPEMELKYTFTQLKANTEYAELSLYG